VKPHILVGILGGFGSGSLIHLSGCFLSEQEALGKFIVIAVSIKFPTDFWGWQLVLPWFNLKGSCSPLDFQYSKLSKSF